MIQGLLSGLASNASQVADFLLNLIQDAVGGVLSFLGIHSPSRLFAGIGKNVLRGLEGGLRTSNNLKPLMAGLASDMEGAFGVQLAMPDLPDGSGGKSVSGNSKPQHVTIVNITQNNPLTRDPLQQLREQSEAVAAGIWGLAGRAPTPVPSAQLR